MLTAVGSTAGLLMVAISAWVMPSIQRPTLPFGVRVPAQRATDAAIVEQIRAFRAQVTVSALLGLLVSVVLIATVGTDVDETATALVAAVPMAALLLLVGAFYLRARGTILRVKADDGWYSGVAQRVAVDTSLRTGPERLPWEWAVVAMLTPLVTLAAGIALYPDMPAQVPMRTNGSTVEAWQAKSPWVIVLPVGIQLLTTALLIALLAWSFRSRADLEPSAPKRSAAQHRLFLRRISRAVLVLATCMNAAILFAVVPVWQGRVPGPWATTGLILFSLLGAGYLVVVTVRTGQGGSRIATDRDAAAERPDSAHTDDDRHWRFAGFCYVNRDDPAILVQKRVGVGWTLNLGNPRSIAIVASVLALVAVGAFLAP
ncbi:DUF1648 domain-containing protein [Plantactinospora soyae]|uniref:Membrane protein n=1 Tax=Plantactinospora soyae TaxID=1544732 RepID=A0A927M0P5_9ACTN|nr:DUF5808 domain-containing protein [Plantactinospora soyae]MBE1484632.1 putative membrane protein [Plantactinospora soyae]